MSAAKAMTPWLKKHLVDTGVMTADRVTRRPTTRTCRDCQVPVIAALLDEAISRRLELDPAFLTPLGELQALLLERPTYQWTDGTITDRDPWRITGRPASTVRVLAEHACHSPPFDAGPDPTPETKPRRNPSTECPF